MRQREQGQTRAQAPGHGDGLTAASAFGFAVGDFGFNLYWQGLGLFLIYFHTDVLGLPAAQAGAAYLIASIWDGLSDPLMGLAADRTRSRWGRYRPYLLLGSLPLALAFVLSFSAPRLSPPLLFAWALLTQLLARTLYNALSIPYSALSAVITRDSAVRTTLSGLRMQCAFAGGIAVAWLMPALAQALGHSLGRDAWALAAAIVGLVATATFLWCFAAVREPAPSGVTAAPRGALLTDTWAFLRAVAGNAPLLRLLAARFVLTLGLTMHTRNTMYFLKYVLGAERLAPYILPLLAALSLLSVPLWVRLIRRGGKRGAWQLGCAVMAAGALALHLPAALHPAGAVVLLGTLAAGNTGYAVCFWAMLPDTVEYNEWRSGRRDEAKVFGFASLTQKLGMGLSALAAGLLLDASGFAANQAQSAAVLETIRATMGLIPAAGILLSIWLIRGYAIDEAAHRRIRAALDARRAAGPAGAASPEN